jgi:hypothetical protein
LLLFVLPLFLLQGWRRDPALVDRKFFYGIIYKLAPEWLEALIKDCRKLRSLRKKRSKRTKIEGVLPFFMDMLLDEPFESNSRMTNQMVLVPKVKRKQRRPYVAPAKIIPTVLMGDYIQGVAREEDDPEYYASSAHESDSREDYVSEDDEGDEEGGEDDQDGQIQPKNRRRHYQQMDDAPVEQSPVKKRKLRAVETDEEEDEAERDDNQPVRLSPVNPYNSNFVQEGQSQAGSLEKRMVKVSILSKSKSQTKTNQGTSLNPDITVRQFVQPSRDRSMSSDRDKEEEK